MIDRQMLRNFRVDFAEAVKDLEAKYGIIIELGNIKFSIDNFEAKLIAKEGDSKEDVNEAEFRSYCRSYGLEPSDFDRRFTYSTLIGGDGEDYIIIGIKPSKRTYPIICRRVRDNKTYGFSANAIKSSFRVENK